jgi:hypothetical protein
MRGKLFHGKSANFCNLAGALCVGLVGHRVKGALDPIGLRSDPWSVLNLGRMGEDARVPANSFDQRDVEHVASRLVFTATHDPRLSDTSHTEFVPVWRLRNPLSHPRVPPRLPQWLWGLEFAGGPHSLFVLLSVYQTSGGLKPCAVLAAPVAALAFGSPPAPDLQGECTQMGSFREPMSDPILVVDSSEIREGKLEEVKAGVEDLVAFVEANEAEPLAYYIYFDEAGAQMTVVQIHPDSTSLERHLTVAGRVFRRFADLLTLARVDVYGSPSEAALEQMRSKARLLGNGPVVVHELHSGFRRFAADSPAS